MKKTAWILGGIGVFVVGGALLNAAGFPTDTTPTATETTAGTEATPEPDPEAAEPDQQSGNDAADYGNDSDGGLLSRSKDLAQLDFPEPDAFNAHISDRYNGSAELNSGDLQVRIDSSGFKLTDQGNTAQVLEELGTAGRFDYDSVTISLDTGKGNWGYRYAPDTVDEIAENDVIVDRIWDLAESGTNFAYD
jgi:hypothetical protein